MNIIDKLDNILFEANKIPRGLISWVADYIYARHHGNVKDAKQMKKNLDKEIKKLGLDKDKVYNYFGDPDNPREKDKVIKRVKEYQGYS